MSQQGKLSQIMEYYNKENTIRYCNITTRETEPYTRMLQQWKQNHIMECSTNETDTGMLHQRGKSQIHD